MVVMMVNLLIGVYVADWMHDAGIRAISWNIIIYLPLDRLNYCRWWGAWSCLCCIIGLYRLNNDLRLCSLWLNCLWLCCLCLILPLWATYCVTDYPCLLLCAIFYHCVPDFDTICQCYSLFYRAGQGKRIFSGQGRIGAEQNGLGKASKKKLTKFRKMF